MTLTDFIRLQQKSISPFRMKGRTRAVGEFIKLIAETQENFITSYGGDVPFEIEELDYLDFQHSIGYQELPTYLFRQFNNRETRTIGEN